MRIASIRGMLLFLVAMLAMSSAAFAQFRFSVSFGPPALPVYEQPLCPGDGYIWTPGYWAWSDDDGDYYWVPGTWVLAPEVGFLWTPPYWAWNDGAFVFYDGYWGPEVGFYGGISYGFGYFGEGFVGGRWDNGRFFYNRSVMNVNVTNIHNVYNETVINRSESRVSYNGGNGGINARPTGRDEAAARQRHIPPAAAQVQHMQEARQNRELRASANHGKPPVAATARPGAFSGREAVPARAAGGTYNPPANRGANQPRGETGGRPATNSAREPRGETGARPGTNPAHVRDLPPMDRPSAPKTGNSRQDQKYAQQQQKLQQKQDQERQRLQQRQERDHQQLEQRRANDSRKQQIEQRHQQQTQQLQERHVQQQQHLQQRQAPRPSQPAEKPRKQ